MIGFSAESLDYKKAIENKAIEPDAKVKSKESTSKKMKPQSVNMTDIHIPQEFRSSKPSEEKIESAMQYYQEHGHLDQKIIVTMSEHGWILKDNYTRLLAAQRLQLDTVEITTINESLLERSSQL